MGAFSLRRPLALLFALALTAVLSLALVGCGDDDTSGAVRADNEAPVAVLQMPAQARIGFPVVLDGSASVDSDGLIDEYLFEIAPVGTEPNKVLSTSSSSLTHTFVEPVTYEVVLTVVDSDGKKASDVATIVITQ